MDFPFRCCFDEEWKLHHAASAAASGRGSTFHSLAAISPAMLPHAFLQQWRDKPATAFQFELLLRIAGVLERSSQCLGAAVVGSFAKGVADRVSDLDLIVFCAEGTGEALLAEVSREVPEVFLTFDGSHGAGSPFREFILFNFTSIEVHLITPGTKFTLKQPYVEVINRNGCLQSRSSNKEAPGRCELVAYRHGDKWLPWELFNCIKWLSRGEGATAREYLVKLGRAIEARGENGGSQVNPRNSMVLKDGED